MKRSSITQKRLLYLIKDKDRYLPVEELEILISRLARFTLTKRQIKGSLNNLAKRGLVLRKQISLTKLKNIVKKYGYKVEKDFFSKRKIYAYKITKKGKQYINKILDIKEKEAKKLFRLRNSATTREKQNYYYKRLRSKRSEIRKIKEGW